MKTFWVALMFTGVVQLSDAANEDIVSVEQKGHRLAVEAHDRNEGFGDTTVEASMELIGSDGRKRTRRLTWNTLEETGETDGDKSLTIFHEPRDIAGTAFLSHTNIGRNDDQWLYLPALKRVKRIASANMSSAFVGSEFAYEDLLSDEVERYSYKWLREEPCRDWDCNVVERLPRYKGSGYSRQIVQLDTDEYRVVAIEFYDKKDRLLKTLHPDQYERYPNGHWRAHKLTMTNHRSGKVTVLTFGRFEFQTGIGRSKFSPDTLVRIR